MDREKKRFATLVSVTLLPAVLGITAARAQANGSTNTIPGALPGVHLVSPVAAGQWTMPAGDYANTRYSPLDKINTGNV
jgi:glucose dehydrogenase